MLFDFEPSGINDTYLRLTRNGLSCIVAPAGVWNGLLRVNYIVAGAPGGVAVGKPNADELFLKPGDVVECAFEMPAMVLRNRIVAP